MKVSHKAKLIGLVFIGFIFVSAGSIGTYYLLVISNQADEVHDEKMSDIVTDVTDEKDIDDYELTFKDGCFNGRIDWSAYGVSKNEGQVCLSIGQWERTGDVVNVPIVGEVGSGIESVVVDGKNIAWNSNGEVYQRISLYVYGGLNKYTVLVRDKRGNE